MLLKYQSYRGLGYGLVQGRTQQDSTGKKIGFQASAINFFKLQLAAAYGANIS